MSTNDDARGTAGDATDSDIAVALSLVDGILVGGVGTLQTFALLICVHLIQWRDWPPYVTKNVALVVISTVSGVLWTIATYLSRGFVTREKGDILADCGLEVSSFTCQTYSHVYCVRVRSLLNLVLAGNV